MRAVWTGIGGSDGQCFHPPDGVNRVAVVIDERAAYRKPSRAKIVRNLLAFVRRSNRERAPASLNELVQGAIALRSYEFGVANIEIDEDLASDLPLVRVSREEIQQVLLNLLLNAEHAMKTVGGRGTLCIRPMAYDDGVAVEVHDSGAGVPPAVAARMFEPFFTTKDVGQGTGLGLSLALGIIQAHGGTLILAEASQGARFRLTLPAAATNALAAPHATLLASVLSAIAGQHALVVDDEEPVRIMLQRLLTRRGFIVDLAIDGGMATKLLEDTRYDVVLCDVKMPHVGGLALYESIRLRQPELLDRFVFISGDILNPQLHRLSDSSQVPLLSKPFDAGTLDDALNQVIARRIGEQHVAAVQTH